MVYLPDEAALPAGWIDALTRGGSGNRHAAPGHGGALAVGALGVHGETGTFAPAADDTALAACLDEAVARLTDGGQAGYAAWLDDLGVCLHRARRWKDGHR